jgi:pilus assembly protein CpaC
MKNFILLLVAISSFTFAESSWARKRAVASVEQNSSEEEVDVKNEKNRKTVKLTIGTTSDESLPLGTPSSITFKGSFKRVTEAQYSKENNTIRFLPKREGDAIMTILDSKGKVIRELILIVRKSSVDATMREMQALLGDIEGIQIKIVNNRVVVDGQVLLPRDMTRIHNVISQFPEEADTLVSLSPLAQRKIAEFIARDINNPEIQVRAVNDKFILEGVAGSEEEKQRAEIIAKTYIPPLIVERAVKDGVVKPPRPANDGVINLITIRPSAPPPPGKIIQLVVHYVELKKDYSKGFRFQFTPAIDDKTNLTFSSSSSEQGGVVTSLTGVINNLLPKLNWSKNHGHARILESTSMIVQDGKTGTINAYSEIPYQTQTKDGPSTGFKPVGIASRVTPVILGERSDSLNLDIAFKIDALIGIDGNGPRTSTNQIETSIVVRSGQSAAIGGLIRNSSATGYNNPQGLPQSPLISLYASKDFQRNQSQFVVFITPIIKASASSGADKIKKKFRIQD